MHLGDGGDGGKFRADDSGYGGLRLNQLRGANMGDKMKVKIGIDHEKFAAYQDCVKAKDQVIDALALENGKLKQAIRRLGDCYYNTHLIDQEQVLEVEMDRITKMAN